MRCRKIEKKKFIAESPEYFLRVKKNFHPKPTNSIRKKRKEKKEDIYISPLFRNTSRSNERLKSVPRGPSGIAF